MPASPVVLDLETQHTFQEVGYDPAKLKVSVVGIYDYATEGYETYMEQDLNRLFIKLEHASEIIGYNIVKFDLPVLAPYYVGKMLQFKTMDLLEVVEKELGHRVALDDLARATLGTHKSGHGFLAIDYFAKGEYEKLKKYCLDDVRITKELYEYGLKNGKVQLLTSNGKRDIKVSFNRTGENPSAVSLSLPF